MTGLLQLNVTSTSVGTQVFVVLIVGLLIAFAVQLLLTNLGLTLGITALKLLPFKKSQEPSELNSSKQSSKAVAKISFLAGIGILLTLNSVLFIASFLAIKFSQASEPIAGATLGIVIWSAYFIILIWFGSSTASSVLSLILGSVSKGVKQLLDTIATLINREEDEPQVLTEAAAADLIQQEIQIAFDRFDLQKPIEDYLETIPKSQLNLEEVEQSFEELLTQKFDKFILVDSQIDSQIIENLINDNSNLPDSERELLIERLKNVWQKIIDRNAETDVSAELLKYIESSNPEDLDLEKFSERLEKILNKSDSTNIVWQNLRQFNWSKIKNYLLDRADLSDLDLEDIWQKLQAFSDLDVEGNNERELSEFNTNTIKNDLENYLLNSSTWYLKTERGLEDFKEVIYDPQANSEQVRSQLNEITKDDLEGFLQQREDLNLEEVEQIAEALEAVRQEVFELLENNPTDGIDIKERVINYLQTIDKETLLNPNLPDEIEKVLIGSGVGMVAISQFVEGWHQIDWQNLLQQRNDLKPKQLQQTTEKLSQTKNHLEKKVQQFQKEIIFTSKQLQKKMESYLRYTNLELITPKAIEDKLNQLLPENSNLPELPPIKKEKLEAILAKRKGVNKSKIESIGEQIETSWQNLTTTSERTLNNIQNESVALTKDIIDRVQTIIEENSNLAQIKQDLQQVIKPELLQQILVLDWDEITEKILENEQYSETQIKNAIKKIKQVLRKLLKMPRRWAIRTQKQFKNELEDFLSYGDKNDLTPQQIEHNLAKILDFSLGNEIRKNITQQTPEHIHKILSQRSDLSEIEIQHISDRVNSIVRQLSSQIEQTKAQSNELLAQINEYLNSLNLYQLDYDRLKTNLANFDFKPLNSSVIQILKDVPVEEMSDRLGKLSYEALINLIKANKIVTEAIPAPILNQIQGVGDYVTQQIDTTKQTALDKVEALKQQMIKQAEETQKAIAVATYWLFAITFTSIVSSVVAGVLATKIAW